MQFFQDDNDKAEFIKVAAITVAITAVGAMVFLTIAHFFIR